MTYRNIIQESCPGGKKEFFCRMRDFLCRRNGTYDYSTTGIGWTLHDSSYAVDEDNPQLNDWFVIYSPGEGGKDQLYFHLKWTSVQQISCYGYLYWNNSTHAGVHAYGSSGIFYVSTEALASELSIWGDLDFVHMLESTAYSFNTQGSFGRLENTIYDDTIATCSSSLSSGSDVSIALDSVPSGWAVDDNVFIRDNANVDSIIIKTIVSNTITADLAHSFSANCRLQKQLSYTAGNSYSAYTGMTMVYGKTATAIAFITPVMSGFQSICDPDKFGNYVTGDMHYTTAAAGQSYLGFSPNRRATPPIAGLTEFDVVTDSDSVDWRYVSGYNNSIFVFVKEV